MIHHFHSVIPGRGLVCFVIAALAAIASITQSRAAETVHLYLRANGERIEGESTQTSLGREGSIECLAFAMESQVPLDATTGLPTGRSKHSPVTILKRIDKSSPLLFRAMIQGQTIDAEFRFYRPNPSGDGTTEQFYTVEVHKARISKIKTFTPSTLRADTSNEPNQEEVTIAFQEIIWHYTQGDIGFEDAWLIRAAVTGNAWAGLDAEQTSDAAATAVDRDRTGPAQPKADANAVKTDPKAMPGPSAEKPASASAPKS